VYAPKIKRSGAGVVASLQVVTLTALLLGIRPPGLTTYANNLPRAKFKLPAPADYVETISVSQEDDGTEEKPSESILATDAFDAGATDHAFLINPNYHQLTYRSATFRFSLIRSPPLG